MFQLKTEAFGAFEKYTIQHPLYAQSIAFAPGRGGCLLDLILEGESILDGCQTPQELDVNRWGKSVALYPFPNRLKDGQYQWEGQAYQFPINDGGTGNALHGFGTARPLEVIHLQLEEKQAVVTMQGKYDGELPAYPFPLEFELSYELHSHGFFGLEMTLRNVGDQPIPAGMGWHPYFRLGKGIEALKLQLPDVEMIGVDPRMIPTGKRYDYDEFDRLKAIGSTVLDNCFALSQEAVEAGVHLRNDRLQLRYWQETGPGKFNYLQVFTPPMRESIAIEPMTCNVDAFNNGEGLARLLPGEELRAKAGLLLSLISDNH